MALGGDLIKEYLVGLGFKVDEKALRNAQQSMKTMQKSVMGFVGVMSAAAVGIGKFIFDMQKKDAQLEKDATAQKKSVDDMRAQTNALQVLGVTADQLRKDPAIRDIAKDLQNLGKSMNLPKDAQSLQSVNNLVKGFQKLQLTTKYMMDWSFYQIKNIAARPLNQLADFMGKASAFIAKNIGKITEWVGIGVKIVATFFATLARVFMGLGKLLAKIPGPIKAIGLAIAAVFALIRAGPIGWISAAIMAITLLLDDLFTYLDGGEAALGGFWKACIDGVNKIKSAVDKVTLIFKAFWRNLQSAFQEGGWSKVGATIVNGLKTAFKRVGNLLKTAILGEGNVWNTDATWGEVGQKILEGINNALKAAGSWLKETGAVLWGKIKQGFSSANDFLKGLFGGEEGGEKSWAQIGGDIWDSIKQGFADVNTWFKGLFVGSENAEGTSWLQIGSDLWGKIKSGVESAATGIQGWLAGLFNLDSNADWGDIGKV